MVTSVIHRNMGTSLPVAVRGDGVYLYDGNGKAYLDASGGAAVSCLGHSHPKIVDAICAQVRALPFAHTSFFTNEPLEILAARLAEEAPMAGARAMIVCDGSEAVEAALKLARQFYWERGEPQRSIVIGRRQGYHGNTLGALSASGNVARRIAYAPLLIDSMRLIDSCNAYRQQRDGETPEAFGLRCARQLETEILDAGPERVMAFIVEPVVGATGGCLMPPPGYLAELRRICDRYDILFIADEIMCGLGRTGVLHACAQEGVSPDLLTLAKGLGAGYQSIGAVLASGQLIDMLAAGSGMLANGHTYMGHPVACAAALAVQSVLSEERLIERVALLGPALEARLRGRFGDHPFVGDIRGRGFFWALELVEDRQHKRPFSHTLSLHAQVKRAAMDVGLICYPSGGSIDGTSGDHILLAPPFITTEGQLDELIDKLDHALNIVFTHLPTEVAG